ncbi:MAG: diguanylate cyclase [Halomonas sp.]|nr:diguanylate cyclase [Halomonas sp.]MDP3536794.1 diguanylate cyclase [Halomonas sp.]
MPIARAERWLSVTAACFAITLVVMQPSVSSIALVLLALGLLCAQKDRWLFASLLSAGTIGVLLPGLISYLLPENWVTTARWETLAAWIYPGSVERFRAPLLMTLALQLSALALLLRHRVRLGVPLLLMMAALLTGLQLINHHSTFPPLLRYAAHWPSLLTLSVVLLGQCLSSTQHWRNKRYLAYALWPACGLLIATLLLWKQLHLEAEQRLYLQVTERAQQATTQLSQDIDNHLNTMRRFARIWQLQTVPPNYQQWTDLAASYQQDFAYLINIAFISPDSGIRHVYPFTETNLINIGLRLFNVQPEGRTALEPALKGLQEGNTDIIELLQGGPGIVHYFPVFNAEGVPLGAAAMAVSLPLFAEELFTRLPANQGAIQWYNDTHVLAEHGDTTDPGPWAYHYPIYLLDKSLTLSYQPRRQYLISQLPRLPSISLVIGLILAYLLYLVLYTFQRLGQQHSAMQKSNAALQQEIKKRSKLQQEIEWLARHDELTGIANRRYFLEQMETAQAIRPTSLVLFDIDHFKRVNDQMGHLVGDEYLFAFAKLGEAIIEQHGGVFARYGGEEFVAWLPGHTLSSAYNVADELRQRLAASNLTHADDTPITLSAGVVTLNHPENPDMARMMQAADEALYNAKHRGRNRIERGTLNAREDV